MTTARLEYNHHLAPLCRREEEGGGGERRRLVDQSQYRF